MAATKSIWAAILGAAALSACASTSSPEPKTWTGGDPAHLAADQAACHKETDGLDAGQANAYSDSRYGVASALVEGLDRDDPLRDHRGDARVAAFITCMSNKGWHAG
ncbi:MAG TPA: hypothetical protein VHY32_12470 [Caulobacteraceae bacterium]|jgi:hypothetical protein|nr:hypothetical protein [Caulobacteraceae bacterium]